jgi:hypothetical protein
LALGEACQGGGGGGGGVGGDLAGSCGGDGAEGVEFALDPCGVHEDLDVGVGVEAEEIGEVE